MCVGNVCTRKMCACATRSVRAMRCSVFRTKTTVRKSRVGGTGTRRKCINNGVTEKTRAHVTPSVHARAAQPTAITSGSGGHHVRMSTETLGDETETLPNPWMRGEYGGAMHRGVQHVGTLLRGLASRRLNTGPHVQLVSFLVTYM